MRENIFNILNHSKRLSINVENSNILDLYSGTGSFGIEAISRGAKKVFFVEQNDIATKILKDNLIKLSIINKTLIFNNMIEDFLYKKIGEKFDIFFWILHSQIVNF